MSNLIPYAIADLELQLASAISVGTTSFTLNSANDDDGNAIPAGKYCFTLDSGTSNKEYLIGQVNGTAVTSVKSVSRQGVETTGAVRAHRVGSPCIVTNFATLQRVADILRGQLDLDGSAPVGYDAEPTLADRKDLATVGYVLDTVSGGTVAFDSMTVAGSAGESVVAGNLVYFKTSDQEWYLTDADTAATVEGVQLGIALGSGSDGVAITGGIQTMGTYTTSGLTAGALYYAGNTAGAISSSAGTTSRVIGLALSTTKLLLIPRDAQDIKDAQKDAMAGGGAFGTPSTTNQFLTEEWYTANPTDVQVFTSSGTWTKPTYGTMALIEIWGAGGGGATGERNGSPDSATGGGGGGYNRKFIKLSDLAATVSVTIGAGGTAGVAGGTTTFSSHLSAFGGGGGSTPSSAPHGPAGGGMTSAGEQAGSSPTKGGNPSFPAASAGATILNSYDNPGFGGAHGGPGAGGSAVWGGGAGGSSGPYAGGSSILAGGGGGGGASYNTASAGAGGTHGSFTAGGGGAAAVAAGAAGTAGSGFGIGGGGGGGGTAPTGNAGAGGAGGTAAGGGGGGSVNTGASSGAAGTGGTGGNGYARITTF